MWVRLLQAFPNDLIPHGIDGQRLHGEDWTGQCFFIHRNHWTQLRAPSVELNNYIATYIDCIWFAEPSQSFATSHNRLIKSISFPDWLHFSLCLDKVERKCQKLKLSNLKVMQSSIGLIYPALLRVKPSNILGYFFRLMLICDIQDTQRVAE